MEIRTTLLSRSVGIKEKNATILKRKMSLRTMNRQTKRRKTISAQHSSDRVTRAMTTRSACAATVPIWPEMELLRKNRDDCNFNVIETSSSKTNFVQIICDKKYFPVTKSSCATLKGLIKFCSRDTKRRFGGLREQLLIITSSMSVKIFTTKEILQYFKNVASEPNDVLSEEEMVDSIQNASEFSLIIVDCSLQTTICEVLKRLNGRIPVGILLVCYKGRVHEIPDLPGVLFDNTATDTILKKTDSLLNRCVHRLLADLYSKLAEVPFDREESKHNVLDVFVMLESSFERNKIPQDEWPKRPKSEFKYPENIDDKMSLRTMNRQTKRRKTISAQQSSDRVTRAMTTRSACAATVPIWPEMELSRKNEDDCNFTVIETSFSKTNFVQIICDKKYFPVTKSSCETTKGLITFCSHDIKRRFEGLSEQLLITTSSKSFKIFTTKEILQYFKNVASEPNDVLFEEEMVDPIQNASEFTLIIVDCSLQTTICEVLKRLNGRIPVGILLVCYKGRVHEIPDLPGVLFDNTATDTILKKMDSLLNRCVHRLLADLYSKLAEVSFDREESKHNVLDVFEMLESSFERNKIPQDEWPKRPKSEFKYPENIDDVLASILSAEKVVGCLKKHGKLHVHLNSPTERSDIEKIIREIIANHCIGACEIVFKYINMEYLYSSGDWACDGTLGGFAMKQTHVSSDLNDPELVALISWHVAHGSDHKFLLVGPNQTKLGSIDGMEGTETETMDIYPVLVDAAQKKNCDTKLRTEDKQSMHAKLRNTETLETLKGSIVHIWGHKTSPGLGVVVEKPLTTQNGKIIYVCDREPKYSFAEGGDSGSMVCYYDPIDDILYAVGMLIGRCEPKEADSPGRYAAQVLDDGLQKLSKINKCTLLFGEEKGK